jgi:hypothetical protein
MSTDSSKCKGDEIKRNRSEDSELIVKDGAVYNIENYTNKYTHNLRKATSSCKCFRITSSLVFISFYIIAFA